MEDARRVGPLVFALVIAACGGESRRAERDCEPGETRACPCDAGSGIAACDSGGRFAACACPGTVAVAPAIVEFGELRRGGRREATVALRNDGALPVPIRRVALAPETDPGFAIAWAPEAVPPGGQVALVAIAFEAGAPAPASGTLLVEVEGPQAVLAVPLRATAIGPELSCSPTALDFGERRLGVVHELPVTCRNVGLSGLEDSGLVRSPRFEADDPEFTGAAPAEAFGPGEEFTFAVRYLPVDAGSDVATARLVTAEGLEIPFELAGSSRTESCVLELRPLELTGVPGEDLAAAVVVRNLRDDAGCLVKQIEALPGCAEGFSFELPPPGTALLAGEALAVPVRFQGHEQTSYRCGLLVSADDPEHHEGTVGIHVALSWRPCLVAEGPAELPAISPSCGPSAIELALRNRCNLAFFVDGFRFTEDSSPGFAVGVETPATIPANGSVTLPVRFDPEPDAGEAGPVRATLEVLSRLDADPWSFPFTSERREDDVRSRISHQEGGGALDVLVVIDNGLGMAAESARVVAELGPLPDRLLGHDFRLAVTTTGLVPSTSGSCPGGVSGGEDGRFFPVDGSGPRAIVPFWTPDARAAWENNLAVGSCHDQPAQPLEAALRALETLKYVTDDPRHPEPDDGNGGVFRTGSAALLLVFVGDRDDASPLTPQEYAGRLLATRPTGWIDVVTVAGPPGTGCSGAAGEAATPGDRLHAFAGFANATESSICSGPWGIVDRYETTLEDCFPVDGAPDDWNRDGVVDADDLVVRVAGANVPPIGEDGSVNWAWNEEAGLVCFPADRLPPAGVAVLVRHLVCASR